VSERKAQNIEDEDGFTDVARLSLRDRGLSSAHFLKLVEDQGSLGFWSADLATERVSGTVGLHTLFGLPVNATLTFETLVGLMHPEDRPVLGVWPRTLASGQAVDTEYRIVRRDGTVRWVRNKAEVVLDGKGRPVRALGVVSDITVRQEARHVAQMGQERYQALVRAIAVVVWSASPDGGNRAGADWARLTGQSAEETIGYGWLNVIHPEDRARTREAWTSAVAHQGLYDTDYRILCEDGVYRWFNARGAPILNRDGSIREWVGVCLSITGSKRFQKEAATTPVQDERLTAGQVRAARALLGWNGDRLAEATGISISTIARVEDDGKSGSVRVGTLLTVRQALEAAGVVFIWTPMLGVGLRSGEALSSEGAPASTGRSSGLNESGGRSERSKAS
jgi:PAS domain S-box-containing protein